MRHSLHKHNKNTTNTNKGREAAIEVLDLGNNSASTASAAPLARLLSAKGSIKVLCLFVMMMMRVWVGARDGGRGRRACQDELCVCACRIALWCVAHQKNETHTHAAPLSSTH